MVLYVVLALITGYFLGSIPTAYIVTRIARGKDIRGLGGGNVGTLNTIKEVGMFPAVIVAIIDIGKGVSAVIIAHNVLGLTAVYVILAGIFAVVGHLWMFFLKFSGGRGMGVAIGVVTTALSIYGNWLGLGLFFLAILVPLIITFNVPLAMGIAFFTLPFIVWFGTYSLTGTILAAVGFLLVGGKFTPTVIEAWKSAKTKRELIFIDRKMLKKKGR